MGSIALFSQSSDLTGYSKSVPSPHTTKESLKDLDKNTQDSKSLLVASSPSTTLMERDPNLPGAPAYHSATVTMTKSMQHQPQHDQKNTNIRNKSAVVETPVPDIAETSSQQHERAPQVAKTITDLHHSSQQSILSPSLSSFNTTISSDRKPQSEQQEREPVDRKHNSVAVASGDDVNTSRQDDQSHSAFRFPPPEVTGLGIEPMESPKRPDSSSESLSSSSAADRKLENESPVRHADDLRPKEPGSDTCILSALLGISVDSWNFSEESLAQALRLKTEQEKTKQEYYRLETRRKSLKLLSEAIRCNIPSSSIPLLFQHPEDATVQAAIASVSESSAGPMSKRASISQPSSKQQLPLAVNIPVSDRDRYPSHAMHQRNMSLPNQMYMDPMTMTQRAHQPPIGSLQQSQFKPGHHHHTSSSSSSLNSSAYSPVRQPATLYQSGRRNIAPHPYIQPPPPPQAPSIISPSSSSNSLHHIIQFHHWQPNQTSSQPKKQDSLSPRHEDDNQSIKRRRSLLGERSGSPEQSGSNRSLAASAAAAVHANRRKSMHARHRSEASIPHTASWASNLSQQQQRPQRQETIPEDNSGVSILATVAAASTDDDESKRGKDKRGKHNIGFVMSGS